MQVGKDGAKGGKTKKKVLVETGTIFQKNEQHVTGFPLKDYHLYQKLRNAGVVPNEGKDKRTGDTQNFEAKKGELEHKQMPAKIGAELTPRLGAHGVWKANAGED